jgi:DNA polymerase II small subunit/DNA polymerase delta subunit B
MRTTIDIPDETYRTIKVMAAERGTTVRELVLEGLEAVRQKKLVPRKPFTIPLIPSTRKDKLVIDNETIYDLIDFP